MGFTVTFIRHAETEFNVKGLIHGDTGGTITEEGVRQATALGNSLKNQRVRVTRVISSDLERCIDTAKYILEQLEPPVPEITLDSRLRKKAYGQWEGKPISVMFEATKEKNCTPEKAEAPGGESHENVFARTQSFMEDLVKLVDETKWDEENVLVVTHGMNIHLALKYLDTHKDFYDLGDFVFVKDKRGKNTDVTRLSIAKLKERNGRRRVQVLCVNDCSHLNV